MRGAAERRIATAGGQDPTQTVHVAIVVLCVLGTACAYVACIVLVMGGHVEVLFHLVLWLAVTALATILVVTFWALAAASRERLRKRQALTAERICALAASIRSLDAAEQTAANKQLIRRLDVTRDALGEVVNLAPFVRYELIAAGLAVRVDRELMSAGSKWRRVSAAGVLGLLRAAGSVGPLRQALKDPDLDVAYAAAQALSRYRSGLAYDGLLDGLGGATIPPARVASLLEAFRCPAARELVEARAGSHDRQVRYWVAYLLGSLADPRSAPVIQRLAQDPDENVRANAAESLASFPNEAVLARLLADESWVVRSHAAKAAGLSGQTNLAPRLAELLEDRSWWVRQNATLALAAFGEAAIPSLLPQLHSHDRFARNKAAEALIRCGHAAEQIDRLKADLPGGEAARQFLVDLGRAEAVRTIEIAARGAETAEGRERLISVLEEIGTGQAHAALEQLGTGRP